MIRQSVRTGRTFSTSSIQREVIQAQGHSGSNQNCTSSSGCPVTSAATAPRARVFPRLQDRVGEQADLVGRGGGGDEYELVAAGRGERGGVALDHLGADGGARSDLP